MNGESFAHLLAPWLGVSAVVAAVFAAAVAAAVRHGRKARREWGA